MEEKIEALLKGSFGNNARIRSIRIYPRLCGEMSMSAVINGEFFAMSFLPCGCRSEIYQLINGK